MMTYKEYMDWQIEHMSAWKRFWFYMASTPDWHRHYYTYALGYISKSKSLEEVREAVNIALGR